MNCDTTAQLSDSELLTVLLGGPKSCDKARVGRWLKEAGGLSGLAHMSCADQGGLHGYGPARHARVLAAVELGRRLLERSTPDGDVLVANPSAAAACFKARLIDLPYEVFACLFLDTRHHKIAFEILFRGSVNGAAVYPREIVRRALHLNAAAVICGHNHPSGDCGPSEADRRITQKILKSLALVDIRLLDHLVIARSGTESLAQIGWL